MAQSARLGAWEARLEALAADVRALSMHMERDGAAHVDKKVVSTFHFQQFFYLDNKTHAVTVMGYCMKVHFKCLR